MKKTWKLNETRIARFFGYIGRNSLSGGNSKSGTTADNHPKRHRALPKGTLYIEVKRRKGGTFLSNLYLKEKVKAKKEKKILLLALVTKRHDFILMRKEDLLAIATERKQALTVDMQDVIISRPKRRKKVAKIKLF
jgi:hypothetical protein